MNEIRNGMHDIQKMSFLDLSEEFLPIIGKQFQDSVLPKIETDNPKKNI